MFILQIAIHRYIEHWANNTFLIFIFFCSIQQILWSMLPEVSSTGGPTSSISRQPCPGSSRSVQDPPGLGEGDRGQTSSSSTQSRALLSWPHQARGPRAASKWIWRCVLWKILYQVRKSWLFAENCSEHKPGKIAPIFTNNEYFSSLNSII